MLTKIGLTNFKCYRGSHEFPLSQFNLLTGINGRGKSTLLQSLLLMKQTTDHDKNANYLVLNGSCVQLGAFEDIKNSFASHTEGVKLSFKIIDFVKQVVELDFDSGSFTETEEDTTIVYELQPDVKDNLIATITSCHVIYEGSVSEENQQSHIYSEPLFVNLIPSENEIGFAQLSQKNTTFFKIQFISADRIGPKNYYEIQNINRDFSWVGAKGENTASILLKKKDDKVQEDLYLGEDTNTLLQQTEEWLNFVFDGAKITINTEGGVVLISYNTKQGRERYKPANVGFGYSYILPIVVAGLIAEKGEILIIENPEAHLHPRAQHKLTQFLAKIAATGVQIFVESHSEHILNALRICILEQEQQAKILNNTDVSILYFQNNDEQPFVSIPLDEKGNIEEWPEGFFDQTDKDFKILFGF